MDKLEELDRIVAESGLIATNSKFRPKLTKRQQGQLLAIGLQWPDINREAVALYFGINRANVAHCWNRYSVNYRPIRRKMEEMGRRNFLLEFLDEELIFAVKAIQDNKSPPPPTLPSVRADRHVGEHISKNGHVFNVYWDKDGPFGVGYYNMGLDEAKPAGPHNTSTLAFKDGWENI
jgi:hypothetical protein